MMMGPLPYRRDQPFVDEMWGAVERPKTPAFAGEIQLGLPTHCTKDQLKSRTRCSSFTPRASAVADATVPADVNTEGRLSATERRDSAHRPADTLAKRRP